TMQSDAYRLYARTHGLGERLFGVITRDQEGTRTYRSANAEDERVFRLAQQMADAQEHQDNGLSAFPHEPLSEDEPRRLNVRAYGYTNWDTLFNPRQRLALATFGQSLRDLEAPMARDGMDPMLGQAVKVVLGLAVSNVAHYLSNMATYLSDGMISAFSQ